MGPMLRGMIGAGFAAFVLDPGASPSTVAFWITAAAGSFAALSGQIFARNLLRKSNVVPRAPGGLLLSVVEFLFTKRSVEQVFVPTIVDMRDEYFEALSQNRIWKARWVRLRGTWKFFVAMGLDRVLSLVWLCAKIWRSVN